MADQKQKHSHINKKNTHKPVQNHETVPVQDMLVEETIRPETAYSNVISSPRKTINPAGILSLQRILGNQAVERLLARRKQQQATAMRQPKALVQHNLTVNRPNDIYKQKATKKDAGADSKKSKKEVEEAIKKAAGSLTEIAGTANASDKEGVLKELIKVPLPGLTALKKKGIKVVVCRNSVVEVRTDLKGVRPRGWPAGKTWDIVPGLYDSAKKQVIIATVNGKPSTAHGSHNLVLHEVGHAIGAAVGGESDAKFIKARNKDKAKLGSYESQAGKAGLEETYAESFARFHGKDPKDAKTYPNLHAYWNSNPLISGSK